mmetsp:Transcript_24072/g.37883  ORF Transcript_24072/g.37883 Transcript_24072/m.37883 type:complete len:252 (+) Transcript_24072:1544-2299(+)
MDVKDFESAFLIGNAKFNLPVESAKSPESRIQIVRAVGSTNNDNLAAALDAIHEGKKHGDDTTLKLAVCFVTSRSNRVNLIYENNSRSIFLSLLERPSKIGFTIASHLRHNFGTVDEEEESAGFVRDGLCDQRLTGSRRTMEQHSLGGLDTESLEQRRVTERELDHLTNGSKLLSNTTNILVANIKALLMVLPLDWISVAMDNSFWSHNTVLAVIGSIDLHDLELHRAETLTDDESITFPDRTVSFQEVRL